MSEAAPLLAVLRRVRRRLRLWSTLEGAVIGAAAGLLLAALALAAARLRGAPAGAPLLVALAGGSVVAGAIWRAARRIPLSRCARLVDAALDRQERVLSALSFADERAPSPLVRALVADAVSRAARLPIAGAAPARRPRGLVALGVGAGALALAAAFPVQSGAALPPARGTTARTQPLAPPLAAGALDVEREEVGRAAEAAAALENQRVAALAGELQRGLRGLARGELDDGQMLDLLKSVEAQAAEAARAAERDARALEASQRALATDKATRAAAESLAAKEANAAEQTRAALGASAENKPKETGRALADAARGVAESVGRSGAGGKDGDEAERGKRRLAREREQAENRSPGERGQQPDEDQRRLERLQRDLDETARTCEAGDPRCREQAQQRADDLSRLARRAAAGESFRRLERAARQMRGRLGRGDLRDEGATRALRQFERGAQGQPQSGGQGERQGGEKGEGEGGAMTVGEGEGRGEANGAASGGETAGGEQQDEGSSGSGQGAQPGERGKGRSGDGKGAAGEAARALERIGMGGGASPGEGGIGDQAGGNPLGRKGTLETRGRATEAEVASGAGPSRAEVIGGAASRGFVTPGYARVFADYEAAVEDALGATAVPEGKRYIVRRYFDLIRPREGTRNKP